MASRQFPARIARCAMFLVAGACAGLASAVVLAGPFESTYRPFPSKPTVIENARILTGDGTEIESGHVMMADGLIIAVGAGPAAELDNARRIDASGKWITPGIIDVHSHIGGSPAPNYSPHSDINERTAPVTAEVWVEHSVWPQDPHFPLALAGGVTTLQVLPGSANLFGGRSVVIKNVPARSVQEMKFPGAPYGLKMACGENPKRVYGSKGKAPGTRMGNVAGYRSAWIEAEAYKRKWEKYDAKLADYESGDADGEPPEPPKRHLELETLAGVLRGDILVHNHCYRADEMAVMLDVAKEFGYQITAFHHAVESYKIADMLAEQGVCSAMWADWGRFKLESFDAIEENIALVDNAGACAIVHSDSDWDIQRLNQEAAKAMAAGRRMGLSIDAAHAVQWLTLNAARALGIADRTGSIAPGKMADVVLWDGDPFSVYTHAEKVFVDGALLLDRETGLRPVTDFELGQRETLR